MLERKIQLGEIVSKLVYDVVEDSGEAEALSAEDAKSETLVQQIKDFIPSRVETVGAATRENNTLEQSTELNERLEALIYK